MQVQALRKYAKVYDIPYHPSTGKEDLAGMISKHWDKMVRCHCTARTAAAAAETQLPVMLTIQAVALPEVYLLASAERVA